MKARFKMLLGHLARLLPNAIFSWMLSRYPQASGIELTNICNANCSFCAYRFMKRKKMAMDKETFQRSLDFLSDHRPQTLNLTPTVGDPLIVKDLAGIITEFKSRGFENIFFYTNAIALMRHDLPELLRSGVSRIAISTVLGSADEYAKSYGVDKHIEVIENIKALLAACRQYAPQVTVTAHLRSAPPTDKNNTPPPIRDLLDDIGEEHVHYLEEFLSWGDRIDQSDIPAHATLRSKPSLTRQGMACCAEMYRRIHVYADGKVGCCPCMDMEATITFGSIQESRCLDLWRGPALNKLRDSFRRGMPPALCRGCDSYLPLDVFITKNKLQILMNFLANTMRSKNVGLLKRRSRTCSNA